MGEQLAVPLLGVLRCSQDRKMKKSTNSANEKKKEEEDEDENDDDDDDDDLAHDRSTVRCKKNSDNSSQQRKLQLCSNWTSCRRRDLRT